MNDNLPIREFLKLYYKECNLPEDGGITERWATYQMGSILVSAFPNFRSRRLAIPAHDVNHLLIDQSITRVGEANVAAFELGSGIGRFYYLWWLHPQTLIWSAFNTCRIIKVLYFRTKKFEYVPFLQRSSILEFFACGIATEVFEL